MGSDKAAWIRRQETLLTPQLLVRELEGATITEEDDVQLDGATHQFPGGVAPAYDAELYERGRLSSQSYHLLDAIGLPFNGVDRSINPVEVGPGVFQLVGGSHHSFRVEQANGLVLVDAPFYEERGAALVDFAAEEVPGTPITHVVASHFHEDMSRVSARCWASRMPRWWCRRASRTSGSRCSMSLPS